MTDLAPDDPSEIAKRLEWVRIHYGYASKGAFAEAIGVSQSRYANWITKQQLSLDGAKRVARLHNVTLDFLFLGRIEGLSQALAGAWLQYSRDPRPGDC